MKNLRSRLNKIEQELTKAHFDAYLVYKDYFSGQYKNFFNGASMSQDELLKEAKNKSTIVYITDYSRPTKV